LRIVGTTVFFAAADPAPVQKLLVGEPELLLGGSYFLHQFTLIVSLLGHNLAPQVLHLEHETSLDGFGLLSHDVSPDGVDLVENLGNGRLGHLTLKFIFNLQNCSDSLSRDPIVVNLSF
jgi:hypothetical protein